MVILTLSLSLYVVKNCMWNNINSPLNIKQPLIIKSVIVVFR